MLLIIVHLKVGIFIFYFVDYKYCVILNECPQRAKVGACRIRFETTINWVNADIHLILYFYRISLIASIRRVKSAGNTSPMFPMRKVSACEILPG